MIIHCVKAWEELIKIRHETDPSQPWIIHGFRGKPELAKRLIREGFLFSVGEKINIDSLPLIPINSLFCETDEDDVDIRDIYQQAAHSLNMRLEAFADEIAKNVRRVFPTLPLQSPITRMKRKIKICFYFTFFRNRPDFTPFIGFPFNDRIKVVIFGEPFLCS